MIEMDASMGVCVAKATTRIQEKETKFFMDCEINQAMRLVMEDMYAKTCGVLRAQKNMEMKVAYMLLGETYLGEVFSGKFLPTKSSGW